MTESENKLAHGHDINTEVSETAFDLFIRRRLASLALTVLVILALLPARAGEPAAVSIGDVIPEDFGWCIRVASRPHSLYVACAGFGEPPDCWRVFAFAERGVIARLFGRDRSAESVASLFAAVRRCLESTPAVRGLREKSE